MNVETILRTKGRDVATIRPSETVASAADILISRNIGALVVSEDGQSVDGIISERDIVHGLTGRGADLLSLEVAEVMTRRVVTCDPGDTIDHLMAEMTNRRIRHFPVVQDGRLCGSSTRSNTRRARCVRSSPAPEGSLRLCSALPRSPGRDTMAT